MCYIYIIDVAQPYAESTRRYYISIGLSFGLGRGPYPPEAPIRNNTRISNFHLKISTPVELSAYATYKRSTPVEQHVLSMYLPRPTLSATPAEL